MVRRNTLHRWHLLAGFLITVCTLPATHVVGQDDEGRWSHNRFPFRVSKGRDNGDMKSLVSPVCETAGKSTVQIFSGSRPVAFGLIVGENGLIVTKQSELTGGDPLRVRLPDQRLVTARVAAVRREADLALLQADATGLTAGTLVDAEPPVGSFLITVGRGGRPLRLGVVSVAARRVEAVGRLGVQLDNDSTGRVRVGLVVAESGADDAGILPGDQILAVDGQQPGGRDEVIQLLKRMFPGESVRLTIARDGDQMELDAQIREFSLMEESPNDARLNGPRNSRLSGFDSALQHDTVLDPNQCGGPVVDSEGRIVGLNIARAGRVVSYALPAALVAPLVADMIDEVVHD
jgi:S1-C subfamily serine protease